MEWNSFLGKVKDAKKAGIATGISVPAIATLIYMGSFDNYIDPSNINNLDFYRKMFEDVKKALDSKANLPSKKKTDIIGLSDVDGPITLALWRSQNNPIATYSILSDDSIIEWLKTHHGFEKYNHQFIKMVINKNPTTCLVDKWSWIFSSDDVYKNFAYKNSPLKLALFGIVIDPVVKPFKGDRERLEFKLFTGQEVTGSLTIWPDKEGVLNPFLKETITNGTIGMVHVTPNKFAGQNNGNVEKFVRFLRL